MHGTSWLVNRSNGTDPDTGSQAASRPKKPKICIIWPGIYHDLNFIYIYILLIDVYFVYYPKIVALLIVYCQYILVHTIRNIGHIFDEYL